MTSGATGRTAPLALFLAGALGWHGGLGAQSVVRLEAGGTSASGVYGARAEWYHDRFDGWLGLHGFEDVAVGGRIHTKWSGLDLAAGDVWLSNALPTDRFGGGWSLLGRGLAVADSSGGFGWTAFVGRTARPFSLVPGLVTAEGARPLGLAELRWRLTPGLELGSRQGVTPEGRSQLHFGSWSRGPLRFDASLGRLQGEEYGAVSATVRTPSLDLDASWTAAPRGARRVAAEELRHSELAGLNARAAWRPARRWRLAAGRVQRRPSPFLPDTTPTRTVYDGAVSVPLGASYSAYGGVHVSPAEGGVGESRGFHAGVNGQPARTVRGSVSVFGSRSPSGETSFMAIVSAYDRIRPDLEILQRLQYDGSGTPTLSFGGQYVRGGTRIGVDYRTDFVPGGNGSQFRTALVLDVRVALSSTSDLAVSTYLDSSGRASYRFKTGQWLYPDWSGEGGRRGGGSGAGYEFQEHVVRGRVVLRSGEAVEGAAVQIGDRIVFTDARGRFMLRSEDRRAFALAVLPEAFLLHRGYRVVDAPDVVTSAPEDDAPELLIVLERTLRRRDAPPPEGGEQSGNAPDGGAPGDVTTGPPSA